MWVLGTQTQIKRNCTKIIPKALLNIKHIKIIVHYYLCTGQKLLASCPKTYGYTPNHTEICKISLRNEVQNHVK